MMRKTTAAEYNLASGSEQKGIHLRYQEKIAGCDAEKLGKLGFAWLDRDDTL